MNLCLGTAQFGLNYGIQSNGQPQEEAVFNMLSYAIDNGVTLLDTASAYGSAETVLGKYFSFCPSNIDKVGVVSKLKPDSFTENNKGEWSEIAIKSAKSSLDTIGIKKFEAYLFHNATYIFNDKAVEALAKVKEVGLADRIGVSIYSPEEAMKALEYPSIGAIQIPYNVFDRRLDKAGFFEIAKEKDVLVFARSSLLQGLIMMDANELPEKVKYARGYIERFHSICKQYKVEPLQVAIGYVGCRSGIDYVVFGSDNIKQLEEYIELKDFSLPRELIQDISRAFENVEDKVVNPTLWR
ncbi:MAG: aldo/keto reductase [Lachnospiraceae bacterium]|nr:aldo/keto reductase [Lachnospiraceae bacterium]